MTLNTNERIWHLAEPRFELHLVTKSCGKQELGLPTSSAAVHLQKMMLCMMFQSIQTLCKQQIYWMFPVFRAWIDFLFTIFVCTLYRLWASYTNFAYHWCKICNVLRHLTQISERQCDPRYDTPAHDDAPPYQVCFLAWCSCLQKVEGSEEQTKTNKKKKGGQLSSNSRSRL